MADLIVAGKSGRKSKQPPRIDLTPMVDLGFLLITFFMFTTTLAQHKVMDIKMPTNEHPEPPMAYTEESTITLIPVAGHRIAYYGGSTIPPTMKATTFKDVRSVLLQKQKDAAALPASYSAQAHQLHVIIKPEQHSVYSDMVTVLDEMAILSIPYYVIADITPDEAAAAVK